jgi:phosphatidylserine decarboxylase
MAKSLRHWISTDVRHAHKQPLRFLSEQYFFRDPVRPIYADASYFFAPADGVILYQRNLAADETLVEIKGRSYSLREAMRNDTFAKSCLVIGIFMTLYDVHVNRVPFAGTLNFEPLPPIDTYNRPMLAVEEELVQGHASSLRGADYLFSNQRVLSRVFASTLGLTYYLLQIADYDVACITPFGNRQNRHYAQNERFSQIRFGSQVDLIIPLTDRWRLQTLLSDTTHVQAGVDPLVRITAING